MKLTVDQRSKLFNLIRKRVLPNKDKISIISSDHPNKSFVYMDDDYVIVLYFNHFMFGVMENDTLLISLHDKKTNHFIKFDSGDYILMKNRIDFDKIVYELNKFFDQDTTDNSTAIDVDKILSGF